MLLKQLLSKENLYTAMGKVISNGGNCGIDNVKVEQLYSHLKQHGNAYVKQIAKGSYKANAILGVEIPKSSGGTRLLGIPTVVDRLFQQALCQVLSPLFEPTFSKYSYGFRVNRNAHDAVRQSHTYINSGYNHIVDIDLKNFFDEVEHYVLLELIYKKVKCPKILKLLRSFLRAPLSLNGRLNKRRKGVPQGSPLSPLLSNILLNELDKELEKRELRFIRYADDFSIYLGSELAAERVDKSIRNYLRERLKLSVNIEKSGIRNPDNFNILGFTFVKKRHQATDIIEYLIIVSENRWKTFKQKLKRLTRKTFPLSFTERVKKLSMLIRGWINYFKLGYIQSKLNRLDGWLRNRLRYCIWFAWKNPERKRKNLIRLGVKPRYAYQWSRSRKGGWAIAQSPILITTITIARLEKRGYLQMGKYYRKVKSH